MSAALEVFEALSEPTGVEEDWRYVHFDHTFSELSLAGEPGPALPAGPFAGSLTDTSGHALIIDGHVVEAEADGISLTRLAELESEPSAPRVAADHNKLAAAHSAFAVDGLVVEVAPDRVMSSPTVIEVQATTAGTASFPSVVVRAGENSEAKIVVIYRSAAGQDLLMVPSVGLDAAAGSNIRFLAIQDLDHAATGVVHQRVRLHRDATTRVGEVGLGGKLGRLDLGVSLEGDGSSSEIVGLYFGEGSQTLDYRMVIDHSGKSTSSDVFLKGAVEDDAQSVFTGLLRIEKDAQKTSTFETNRNLVLSDNAKAHSVPNLEILCDDVICGHGSSVGPLEEDHLYYLRSRGLSQKRAERLLLKGFF